MSDQQQIQDWHEAPTCGKKHWIRWTTSDVYESRFVMSHELESPRWLEWYRYHGPWYGPIPDPPKREVQNG